MAIQHIDGNQKVFGPDPAANPVQYFVNPTGIQSLALSALELGASTNILMDTVTAFSVNVNFISAAGSTPLITFPLVQGMGFVTGIFNGGTPILQSGVLIRSITKATTNPKIGVTKYTIILEDSKTWLLYAYSPNGTQLEFTAVNNGLAQGTSNFNGIIQIAKNSGGSADEAVYDSACGAYPTGVTLAGSVSGAQGSYTLDFAKGGMADTTLLMFALPHHIDSFSPATAAAVSSLQLNTTTKGVATAVVANSWDLQESLPTTMGFAPWSPSSGNRNGPLSGATIQSIARIAASEVSQDMNSQTNLNSMYYSGKVYIISPSQKSL